MRLLLGAGVLRAEDAPVRVEAGGATIDIAFDSNGFDLTKSQLVDWVKECARAVSGYYGKFPVPHARVRIMQGRRNGVSGGRTWGEGGAHTNISVGQHTTAAQLKEDWVLTHEMVHYAFPSVAERHHWIEEGIATYVEPIARHLSSQKVWGDMIRDMPQGLPGPGDRGLDNTSEWGRTYWGGATFCLLADVGIRKNTKNAKGLQDALRAINRAGNIENDWLLKRALDIGDKATDGKTMAELYDQMATKPFAVDLQDLWKQLGARREGTFDNSAPLAAIRAKIA